MVWRNDHLFNNPLSFSGRGYDSLSNEAGPVVPALPIEG